MECTKLNCPMQVGTVTENCGDSCPWRTTVNMDDLISRAAAIDAIVSATVFPDAEYIKNLCQNPANSEDWLGGVCGAINAIEEVNAVDAVPVIQGEWVEEPDRVGHYHCSNCGVVWGVSAMAMKHCPNCIAKMTNSPLWDMEDEAATEMTQYCERYELTYNPEDGSM